jgi:multidrug efflux pump subunit AcrA (membrane-fusion protein)
MENISKKYHIKSLTKIYRHNKTSKVRYWFLGFFIFLGFCMFLPWTQNIRATGQVTTLRQEQRPQELNTIIPGRVLKWYVKEGDMVKAGDTILFMGEIKDDYLDTNLVRRTVEQIDAKQSSVGLYRNKADATSSQVAALAAAMELKMGQLQNKIRQARLKVVSDSADVIAVRNEYAIAEDQFRRAKEMFDAGVIPQVQFEQRNQGFQNVNAKKISAENKYMQSRQELIILGIEISAVQQDYMEKSAKAAGDRFQSLSEAATGEGEIAKLKNKVASLNVRNNLYVITAPQDGQIVQVRKAGIGEILKDGEKIGVIVPKDANFAVEMFIRPLDLPLVAPGQKVRFVFDGFPAIVFSGWPNASFGTFGGVIVAVENTVSTNGKFRVLVAEDTTDKKWPYQLRMGTGAMGIALLKDVPVWYELWRNINGFPPDYYKPSQTKTDDKK